jgi:hypothetical protein
MRTHRPPVPVREFQDRRGIPWEDRYLLLPSRTVDWPPYTKRRKHDDDDLQGQFHRDFYGRPCWLCGRTGRLLSGIRHHEQLQLHHLFAGSRGRSHERELFTYLCRQCHENANPSDYPTLLWAKWCFDSIHTDWELLTIRHGSHFVFELQIPAWYRNKVLT